MPKPGIRKGVYANQKPPYAVNAKNRKRVLVLAKHSTAVGVKWKGRAIRKISSKEQCLPFAASVLPAANANEPGDQPTATFGEEVATSHVPHIPAMNWQRPPKKQAIPTPALLMVIPLVRRLYNEKMKTVAAVAKKPLQRCSG